jgi:hypothetical protein
VAANQKNICASHRQSGGGNAPGRNSVTTLVRRRRPGAHRWRVPGPRLGTAPIQKPPSGAFYQAGEYCPQVDAGKTTQDHIGRSLIGRLNNGLRWQYV